MNQLSSNNPVMLPSDLERQKIFYWLQKVSSVTAWRRIFGFYRDWANTTESSLRIADEAGWVDKTALPQVHYALILKGLAHCEEGVARLRKGDKRVFKFDANGEFAMAKRVLFHWAEMTTRIETGENVIDEKHTPLWLQFNNTLTAACQAWQECAQHILETRYTDDPGLTLYGQWMKREFINMPFPSHIPPVPNPIDNIFVGTNESIPCSGIWEPIAGPKKSMISLFTGSPKLQPPFAIAGAMNYLHGGSAAPRVSVETATDNLDLDTTWRLLWRDDRYLDGIIPEIEKRYQFTKPEKITSQSPLVSVEKEMVWATSGATVPIAGKWLVDSEINASMVLQKGDKLPLHNGREVRWVLAEN